MKSHINFAHWIVLAVIGLCLFGTKTVHASVYISGRVAVEGTHTGISDATLTLFPNGQSDAIQVARTLQNGSFVMHVPVAGSYRLEVEGGRIEPTAQVIDVPRTGVTALQVSVRMIPTIRVILLGPDKKPVSGGQIRAWAVVTQEHNEGQNHSSQTRGTGFTRISSPEGMIEYNAPQGSSASEATSIIVGARDEKAGCGMLHLDKWPEAPVTLQLDRGVTLSGTVLGADGKPLALTPVGVQPGQARVMDEAAHNKMMMEGSPCFYQGSLKTTTDKTGHFEIGALFPGCTLMVLAARPGDTPRYKTVELNGDRIDVTLQATDPVWPPNPFAHTNRLGGTLPPVP